MYHSITYGEKNTWDDWHLVPSSRPLFAPPPPKEKTLDIPGGDGLVDLSTSLTGYPVFNNREGSTEFYVMNGYQEWYELYSEIMTYLHGHSMRAFLEDNPDYFYEGRFKVNEWRSDKDYSRIVIDYNVKPYKRYITTTTEPWQWDPFNFRTGVILDKLFKDIPVTTQYKAHTFTSREMGTAPVYPEFHVNTSTGSGVQIRFVNPYLGIDMTKNAPDGKSQFPEFLICRGEVTLYFRCASGSGTVSVDFRPGRL